MKTKKKELCRRQIREPLQFPVSMYTKRRKRDSRFKKRRKRDSVASARTSQRGKRVRRRVDEAKSQELGPSFADFPSAITSHILLHLPIKSLLICRRVCKTWNEVISDPHFARLHFQRSQTSFLIRTNDPKQVSRTLHLLQECNNHLELELKLKLPLRDAKLILNKRYDAENLDSQRRYVDWEPKDDKFDVVNSCNGFLCLSGPRVEDPLVVCNPITGEFIKLPKASKIEKTHGSICSFYFGFGFQPKTNEYKVIRMWETYTHDDLEFCENIIEIHTLGTSIWRYVGVDPTFMIKRLKFPSYLNGALHWIRFGDWSDSLEILCFNFESERFQTFPPPPELKYFNDLGNSKVSMVGLRGFLYICDASMHLESLTIWIMDKYGIEGSWTKVFSIHQFAEKHWLNGLYFPVHFLTDAGILMYDSCSRVSFCISVIYGLKFYKVCGTKSQFEAIPHIPSLISLKDVVKGDSVEMLNVHSRCAKLKLQEENEVLFLAQYNVQSECYFPLYLDDEEWCEEYSC